MKMFSFLALAAGLVLAGPPAPQMQSLGPKDTWAAAKLSAVEIKEITSEVEQSAFDTPASWEEELLVRRIDLGNGPGIVAQGTSLLCGGTGNCQIFVLRKINGKWVSLFGNSDAPIADDFQFGPGVTHGIKDLTVSMNSSANTSARTVYAFDGKLYREAKGKAR